MWKTCRYNTKIIANQMEKQLFDVKSHLDTGRGLLDFMISLEFSYCLSFIYTMSITIKDNSWMQENTERKSNYPMNLEKV